MNQQHDSHFDVIVLGGGSAGYATSLRCAQLGLRVALVERDRLGGTCLHAGCIPTKAMLHVAEVAEEIRGSDALGLLSTLDGVDVPGMQAFKAGIVARLYRGLQGLIEMQDNIVLVSGNGTLVDSTTVSVDGRHLSAAHIVLATGSAPRLLPNIPATGRVLTSESALELDVVPDSVVIIGGSVIGVEFASAWRSLGAEVTIVEALSTIVPLEDPSVSKQLGRAFRKRKIAVRAGVGVADVEQDDTGATVVLQDGARITAEYVLVAIGRGPVTEGLGLDAVGVTTERGWVLTDERLRTSIEGVYAVGDLVPGPQLAHRGFAHGIFVAEQIAGSNPEPVVDSTLPRVTYCDPEITSVGLTEPEAREIHGDSVTVQEYNLAGNGKSQVLRTTGFVKLVSDSDGRIIGVHMVGARMGEQAGEAGLMVHLGLRVEDLARVVHAHPTQNEALGEALLALAGKPLHSHP
ncbi:dihydrolipoyl dehydrogenase [Rhodococcus fascians]|nr:dihydrolipoyl dehydrogenase [Rhodococcus fascians]MBY4140967.1 dihydrolipoyl dehydrogenase [Rhodococcus fascians]MBY4219631.1 dihydrolipoyl dehydrogenase [Rhodococcus fascians]MBY4221940.1 dihydrolipoyl dehydrogenase [Rhodococcus fascians]MBY4233941.1 dihydrolipoyl dehydrogenase [Rhodococcus fascians]